MTAFAAVSLVAATATFWLGQKPNIGAVRASAFLSLIAWAFFTFALPNSLNEYDLYFFGGSFVGMCSKDKAGYLAVGFAAALFTPLFYFLSPMIDGMGGALGLSAFLSSAGVLIPFHARQSDLSKR